MRPGVSMGVLGYPGVSWGNQTDPHKAACHTLSKAFLKSMKTWYRFCWCWRYFSHRILRLKICSVVLLPALNPACSSAIISSAWGLSLFKITFSMTLLE